jgi:hypothetical protein
MYLHACLWVNGLNFFEALRAILGEIFGFQDMNPIFLFHVFSFE